MDSGAIARQLGFLPATGSKAETRLAALANIRTRIMSRIRGTGPERIADGVWVVRGGFPMKTMNVYLLADDGGVTVYDCGISDMTAAVAAAGARLGGIKRVVLGHADADLRPDGRVAPGHPPWLIEQHSAVIHQDHAVGPRRNLVDAVLDDHDAGALVTRKPP